MADGRAEKPGGHGEGHEPGGFCEQGQHPSVDGAARQKELDPSTLWSCAGALPHVSPGQ